MSYSDLLRDPRWQRKRLEVMQRADFACEDCGDRDTTLNVHHTFYTKGAKPWEYDTASLRCLCENCHAEVTDDVREIQRLAGSIGHYARGEVVGMLRAFAAQEHWTVWALCNDDTPSVLLETDEQLDGAAKALLVDRDELLDMLVDDRLTWHAFRDHCVAVRGVSA